MGRTEAELAALGDGGDGKKERWADQAVLGRKEKEESRRTLAVGQPGKAAGETGVSRSPGRCALSPCHRCVRAAGLLSGSRTKGHILAAAGGHLASWPRQGLGGGRTLCLR